MPSIQIYVAEVVEDWLPHLFHAFTQLVFTVIPFFQTLCTVAQPPVFLNKTCIRNVTTMDITVTLPL